MNKIKIKFKNNCWTFKAKGEDSKKVVKYLEKIKKELKINSEERENLFFFRLYALIKSNQNFDGCDYFEEADIKETISSISIKMNCKTIMQFEYLLDQI